MESEGDDNRHGRQELDPEKLIEEMREEYWRGLSEAEDEVEKESVQMLVCEVSGESFAVDAPLCRSISKAGRYTRVPRMPTYVLGVINLRGEIIPVVDMGELFAMGPCGGGEKSRLVMVECGGSKVAFLVDRIIGIEWIEAERIQEPETVSSSVKADYIKGQISPAGDEGWTIYLDMEKIIMGPELSFGE
ncbi:MAG: chemotaxis protein CheW [bacterium]